MSNLNVKRDVICFKRCILGLKIDYSFWSSSGVSACILLLNGNISLGWKRDSFKDQLEASVCKHAVVASYRDRHVSQDNTLKRVSKQAGQPTPFIQLANSTNNGRICQQMWKLGISNFCVFTTCWFIKLHRAFHARHTEIYWVCHNFHYHAGVILMHLCTTHPSQRSN